MKRNNRSKFNRSTLNKLTAILLTVSLLQPLVIRAENVPTFPAEAENEVTQTETIAAPSPDEEAPEEAETALDGPAVVEEDISRRGESEKHFLCEDGSFVAVGYGYPVNYQNEDGTWNEIDNTLFASTDENEKEIIRNTDGLFDIRFSADGTDEKLVALSKDGYDLSFDMAAQIDAEAIRAALEIAGTESPANELAEAVSEERGGVGTRAVIQEKAEVPKQEQWRMAEKVSSGLVYEKAFGTENVNVEYLVSSTGVKENIVLESISDITDYTVTFAAEGLNASLEEDGRILFADGEGVVRFTVAAPVMSDANGETSSDIAVSLTKNEDGTVTVLYTPSLAWLFDEARVYPVRIDPTINTAGTTASFTDTYIASDALSANNSNSTTLKIGNSSTGVVYKAFLKLSTSSFPTIPSGSTITDGEIVVCGAASLTPLNNYRYYMIKPEHIEVNWTAANVGTQTGLKTSSLNYANGNAVNTISPEEASFDINSSTTIYLYRYHIPYKQQAINLHTYKQNSFSYEDQGVRLSPGGTGVYVGDIYSSESTALANILPYGFPYRPMMCVYYTATNKILGDGGRFFSVPTASNISINNYLKDVFLYRENYTSGDFYMRSVYDPDSRYVCCNDAGTGLELRTKTNQYNPTRWVISESNGVYTLKTSVNGVTKYLAVKNGVSYVSGLSDYCFVTSVTDRAKYDLTKQASSMTFRWPTSGESGNHVNSPYGYRTDVSPAKFHYGVDINAFCQPVYAMQDGIVVHIDDNPELSYGKRVVIYHPGTGYCTAYQHLASSSVTDNDFVTKGQQFATSGNTWNSTFHLHFEVWNALNDTTNYNQSRAAAINPMGNVPYGNGLINDYDDADYRFVALSDEKPNLPNPNPIFIYNSSTHVYDVSANFHYQYCDNLRYTGNDMQGGQDPYGVSISAGYWWKGNSNSSTCHWRNNHINWH